MRVGLVVLIFTALLFLPDPVKANQSYSDNKIRKLLNQESIASYSGNCPCPYNRASNGSRCGKRSAYSRPGGHSPLCYERDITDEMVRNYLKKE